MFKEGGDYGKGRKKGYYSKGSWEGTIVRETGGPGPSGYYSKGDRREGTVI